MRKNGKNKSLSKNTPITHTENKKFSMSYRFGRPIEVDYSEMANLLVEWSKKDNATALVQFCNLHQTYPQKIYEWRDASEDFSEALKIAKSNLAERLRERLEKKDANYGLFMSEIGFHDQFYHDYQESLKDAEAIRRKSIEGSKQPTTLIFQSNIPDGTPDSVKVFSQTIPTPDTTGNA